MAVTTARFVVHSARRVPDPNFHKSDNLERHLFMVPVRKFPRDLPLDPNARKPNVRKRVYKQVEASLFNKDCDPGTFHLKNKGICIIADQVVKVDDHTYEVVMERGVHGIVDGGHTSEIIEQNLSDPDLPADQFVSVEVRVGVPPQWIPEIAGGLNTSVQVQDMSLDHLAGLFDWMKADLKGEPYFSQIAWSENDPGEFDARDLVSLLTLFNVALFPNDKDEHPVHAYEKKSLALKSFEQDQAVYKQMRQILKDVLHFHDIVRRDFKEIWNKGVPGGKAGHLAFAENRKNGHYKFLFSGKTSETRMVNGALYPILGAFRWYVERDPLTGAMKWRDGFGGLQVAWQNSALSLLKATHEMSNQLGRNPQSVGKSRTHWSNLHNIVARKDLEARVAAA